MPYRIAPAPPPKIPDGPDFIGAAQQAARRKRRLGIGATLAAAGVAIAALVLHRSNQARHREAFDAARLDLEACLLGPEPLVGDSRHADSCGLRVRHRQLTAMATPVERRIDEALNGWPMRCSEATRRMQREGVELEDLELQKLASDDTGKLATMHALSAPLELPGICVDAAGRARPAHLSAASTSTFPALAAPLNLDALVAHGPPAHPARRVEQLDEGAGTVLALMPAGFAAQAAVVPKEEGEPRSRPDGERVMTDRDWPGVIHIASCQAGKCQNRIVARETFDLNNPELRASDLERFRPARVGGSILAVWRAGTRGGLRMRVAPIDRLAATHDVVVFDDLARDGALQGTPTLTGFRVYGGTSQARIFLVTSLGTWIVNVDETGAFSPY